MIQLLKDPELFVSSTIAICIRQFGMEFLDWDPLVRRDTVEKALGMKKLPQKIFDKINCGATLIGTNGYTQRIEVFIPCNYVMSGRVLTENSLGLDDPYTLAWGVWEYKQLVQGTPETDPEEPFAMDIAVYAGKVLSNDGILTAPQWLDFAEFDPDMMARVEENTEALPGYIDHQAGLMDDINAFVTDRQAKLVAQLDEIDKKTK